MQVMVQLLKEAMNEPGCERVKDFYNTGPVQRAAIEHFVYCYSLALSQLDVNKL